MFQLRSSRALAFASVTSPAFAQLPNPVTVLTAPGNAEHVVLATDRWGFFERRPGSRWSFTCSEAFGGDTFSPQRKAVAMLPGGEALVASQSHGLFRSAAETSCTTTWLPVFLDSSVNDVTVTGDGRAHVLVVPFRNDQRENRVWSSSDGARTFTAHGTSLRKGFVGSALRVAPSDAGRLYVAGVELGDASVSPTLARSTDGGATWTYLPLPATAPMRIAGIHPTDPETIVTWLDVMDVLGEPPARDVLWLSTDGGVQWSMLHEGEGDLPGFAFSPDGIRAVLAGPKDGLWSADVADMKARGSAAFEKILDGELYGLHWIEDGLYAGGNPYRPGGFLLGKSVDGGRTFTSLLNKCEAFPEDCGASSTTYASCNFVNSNQAGYVRQIAAPCFPPPAGTPDAGSVADGGGVSDAAADAANEAAVGIDVPDAESGTGGRDAASGEGTGGTSGAPRQAGSSGCDCSVRPAESRRQWASVLALAALVWLRRARKGGRP